VIEALVVTLPPVAFLAVLFGGAERLRRRNVDMDGEPPIPRRLFWSSKYAMLSAYCGRVRRYL
jgi:hypothetical protein